VHSPISAREKGEKHNKGGVKGFTQETEGGEKKKLGKVPEENSQKKKKEAQIERENKLQSSLPSKKSVSSTGGG